VLRGSRAADYPAVMLISAYAPASGVVMAQREIPAKTREIPEVPDLPASVALVGKVVTADALHTQDTTAHHLRKCGARYVLTVKANRPKLLAAINERFADPARITDSSCEIERGHGVYRIRRIETLDAAGLPFPGAAQAALITRYTCDLATGLPTAKEVVYIITSLPPHRAGAAKIAGYVRAHWAVENQLRYVRDVALREDACRAATGNLPRALAGLRNLAIGALRLAGWTRSSCGSSHYRSWMWLVTAGTPGSRSSSADFGTIRMTACGMGPIVSTRTWAPTVTTAKEATSGTWSGSAISWVPAASSPLNNCIEVLVGSGGVNDVPQSASTVTCSALSSLALTARLVLS
jgi:predicted transposase YbfD/YdcC